MRLDYYRCSFVILTAMTLFILAGPNVYSAEGGDGWRKEFDDICAGTSESQSFSLEELVKLVDRSDKLKPQIEQLGESERKVFLRRLKMCRDLYNFVLETKREGK